MIIKMRIIGLFHDCIILRPEMVLKSVNAINLTDRQDRTH